MRRTPRQARSRETVEIVLTAAAQVFGREGVTATTNRIAERAGVSIGSLHQYFPHKQALLDALVARTLVHAVDGLLHHSPTAPQVQRARVRDLVRLIEPGPG